MPFWESEAREEALQALLKAARFYQAKQSVRQLMHQPKRPMTTSSVFFGL